MSDSLQPYERQPTRLLCARDSPGKTTGVGRHALLQEIFPTQGMDLCFLFLQHWQGVSLPLALPGEPDAHNRKKNQIPLKFLILSALFDYWYMAAFCLIHSSTKLTTHLGLNVSAPEKDITCFSNKEHNLPCPHYIGSTVPDMFLHHGICYTKLNYFYLGVSLPLRIYLS